MIISAHEENPYQTRPAGGRSGAYGVSVVGGLAGFQRRSRELSARFSGLFHEDFGDGRALANDVEAVVGILDADALEVVVFGGSVG